MPHFLPRPLSQALTADVPACSLHAQAVNAAPWQCQTYAPYTFSRLGCLGHADMACCSLPSTHHFTHHGLAASDRHGMQASCCLRHHKRELRLPAGQEHAFIVGCCSAFCPAIAWDVCLQSACSMWCRQSRTGWGTVLCHGSTDQDGAGHNRALLLATFLSSITGPFFAGPASSLCSVRFKPAGHVELNKPQVLAGKQAQPRSS